MNPALAPTPARRPSPGRTATLAHAQRAHVRRDLSAEDAETVIVRERAHRQALARDARFLARWVGLAFVVASAGLACAGQRASAHTCWPDLLATAAFVCLALGLHFRQHFHAQADALSDPSDRDPGDEQPGTGGAL